MENKEFRFNARNIILTFEEASSNIIEEIETHLIAKLGKNGIKFMIISKKTNKICVFVSLDNHQT